MNKQTRTEQKNNIVYGDQAGKDIYKIYYNGGCNSAITRLTQKFSEERKNDQFFNDTIEKIKHYKSSIDDGNPIGLEAKLIAGERKNYIEFAQSAKESFAKKMVKYQLYKSAQELLALLLAEVYQRYYNFIYPQIRSGKPEEIINELIQVKIISYIQNLLEENVLEIFTDDINGMIYFLTGNCHIKWI